IQPGDIVADDLALLLIRHVLEDTVDDFARPGKGRFSMGIGGAPHQVINAHIGPELDAKSVFLETDEDVLAKEITLQRPMLKTMMCYPLRTFAIDVVHAVHDVGCPGDLKFNGAHLQGGIALEHTAEDKGSNGPAHIAFAIRKLNNVLGRTDQRHAWPQAVGAHMQA